MHFISALLFALSANLDNVPLGAAYGIRGVRIPLPCNFLIAVITSLGTCLSMTAGSLLTAFLPQRAAACVGSLILISLGLWFTVKALPRLKQTTEKTPCCYKQNGDLEQASIQAENKKISLKETILLASSLMINNIGFGIGAEIAGIPVLSATLCTLVVSMILLAAGGFIGKSCMGLFWERYAELLSGLIIMALGIYEFFI